MKGIHLLGPAYVVPAFKPEQLVTALMDADTTTPAWNVTFPPPPDIPSTPPPPAPSTFDRIGGCAHKVIRWAFEAQGMFNPPGKITNALGAPPPVDVYIADRRPRLDNCAQSGNIDYGPGSYNPVSLEWSLDQSEAGPTPDWQATDHAIEVNGSNITVRVGNRGTQTAMGVTVQVWWCAWPATQNPPVWNDSTAAWSHTNISAAQNIIPGNEAEFKFVRALPASRYIILAKASCADDQANTDVTHLPPPWTPKLVDLVSGDNNIGLRVLKY